ncbi:MAG: hypothetical protein K8T90_14740 [Planctomycetes bacterium]|nr:hypothetical protein [Planctomycetota bacterium]
MSAGADPRLRPGASAAPSASPDAADGSQSHPDAYPWVPSLLLAVVGASSVWISTLPAPAGRGAAQCVAPHALLVIFDASTALLLVRPGRRGLAETLALAALAAPFHAALGAAAQAGAGAHAALATSCAAWAAMALVTSRLAPRLAPVTASLVVFGLPLAGYGLGEFARLPVAAVFLASPLTGPVVLAQGAGSGSPGDAVPALAAATLASLGAVSAEALHRRAARKGRP